MNHTLRGLRVLNTRPKQQAMSLSEQIQHAGGVVIELPALEIHGTQGWFPSLPDLQEIHKAIFISANAVHYFFTQLKHHHTPWPSSIEVIAIGHGSAVALKQLKIQVHVIPVQPDSEHLLALPSLQQPQKQNILLLKGEGGRPLIEERLLERGANLIALNVYQRMIPKISPQFVKSIWRDDLVDIILLTSEQSMHHLFKLFEEDAHMWLRTKTCLVISERLAQCAYSLGIKNIIRSHPDRMINALIDYVIKD